MRKAERKPQVGWEEHKMGMTDGKRIGRRKNEDEMSRGEGRNPTEKNKCKKAAMAILAVFGTVLLLLLGLGLVWKLLAAFGERSLRDGAGARVPVIAGDGDGEDDREPSGEEGHGAHVWQEGWVRHNGKVYTYNEDILTFLVMGIDKMEPVSQNADKVSGGQADAIFLVVANPDTRRLSLVGINRDTIVDVLMVGAGSDGEDLVAPAQLAVQHGFGDGMELSCELTRDAVAELFYGIPIHGYASFNMGGVAELNDALGGVELYALAGMEGWKKEWTEGAWIELSGMGAFEYVHYRDPEAYESARLRLARQKQYLGAFVQKAVEATKKDITLPVTLYNRFKEYVVTDISIEEIAYLAGELSGYGFDDEDVYTLEGTTRMGEEFEEFYPDKTALRDLVIDLFYREAEE